MCCICKIIFNNDLVTYSYIFPTWAPEATIIQYNPCGYLCFVSTITEPFPIVIPELAFVNAPMRLIRKVYHKYFRVIPQKIPNTFPHLLIFSVIIVLNHRYTFSKKNSYDSCNTPYSKHKWYTTLNISTSSSSAVTQPQT